MAAARLTAAALAAAALANTYTVVVQDQLMFKNIDPIVYPGEYKSHLHSFYGSDAVTANTTTSAELRAGCSTSENPNDLSAYWMPTLLYTGTTPYTQITPMRFSAYYVSIQDAEIPFPDDLKLVAGDASATSQAAVPTDAQMEWVCEGEENTGDAAGFPTSTCSTHLQFLLWFPNCVNPDDLSSYGYRGNGATNYKCPEDGQLGIPQLRFSVRFDLRKIIPNGWSGEAPLTLSCGSSYCAHGDFINGWDATAAENMLDATSKTEFAGVTGSISSSYKADVTCNPTDADPDNGTSDYDESVEMMGM